jgi:hypothetical protein
MVFHTFIGHTLIRLPPSVTYSCSVLLYSPAFSVFPYTVCIHRCNVF